MFLSHIIIPQLQKAAGGGNRVGAADEESSISEGVTDKVWISSIQFYDTIYPTFIILSDFIYQQSSNI